MFGSQERHVRQAGMQSAVGQVRVWWSRRRRAQQQRLGRAIRNTGQHSSPAAAHSMSANPCVPCMRHNCATSPAGAGTQHPPCRPPPRAAPGTAHTWPACRAPLPPPPHLPQLPLAGPQSRRAGWRWMHPGAHLHREGRQRRGQAGRAYELNGGWGLAGDDGMRTLVRLHTVGQKSGGAMPPGRPSCGAARLPRAGRRGKHRQPAGFPKGRQGGACL